MKSNEGWVLRGWHRPKGYESPMIGGAFTSSRTSSDSTSEERHRRLAASVAGTNSGADVREAVGEPGVIEQESNRKAVCELRLLSGLTWDQIAVIFEVSRRTVHNWASGKPLNAANEQRLHALLSTIRAVDRGTARANREALVVRIDGDASALDLLQKGELDKVRALLEKGVGRTERESKPMSEKALSMRTPPRPEELVDALQDPIHEYREKGRAVVSRRRKKK